MESFKFHAIVSDSFYFSKGNNVISPIRTMISAPYSLFGSVMDRIVGGLFYLLTNILRLEIPLFSRYDIRCSDTGIKPVCKRM